MSPLSSSQPAEAASHSLAALSAACRGAEVDAELLHHAIEKQSDECYSTAHRLVRYTRWVGALSLASGLAACVPLYYLNAQVYRVWRIRAPQQVRQYQIACALGAGFALTSFLFVISPIGFLHVHDRRWEQGHELDALAVQALTLRQDYNTLRYWADVLRGSRVALTAQGHHRHEAARRRVHEAEAAAVGAGWAADSVVTDRSAWQQEEETLPWLRIVHTTLADGETTPSPTSDTIAETQSTHRDAPTKEAALAEALFKKEEDAASVPASTPAAKVATTRTWTLDALLQGKRKHGSQWVEEELWDAMAACVQSNEALIVARDETLRRSL